MAPSLIAALLFSAAPKISEVVVYPDRAQVIRTATIACSPAATARFDALPPSTDPSTLRARTSVGTVEGLRSEERALKEAFAPQLKELVEQSRRLEREMATQQDVLARYDERMKVASGYDKLAASLVSGEMVTPKPDLKAWGGAFDAALATRLKAISERTAAAAKLRELSRQEQELLRKYEHAASSSERKQLDAEVLVACPPGKQAHVELSYLVGGASWEPSYEARAVEASRAVELATYATVTQATGEDWSQARLTLSTAVPVQDATPPEIAALRVGVQRREEERKVLVRRDESQAHAEAAGDGKSTANAPSQPLASGKLRVAAQGLSVQLTVPEPADVPGDGKPVRLAVSTARMPATFAYRAVPKLMPFVFRVADVKNTGELPLLPGSVDAFGKSGFIGRYPLERVAQGAPFHLSFGIEDGLKIKRKVAEELKRAEGLFGTRIRFRYAYVFDVANYLGRPEEIELSEHVPVSELDDVKVELEPKTSQGFQLEPADGIVRWRVKLGPSEKRSLDLAFHVDVPSSYDSGGL